MPALADLRDQAVTGVTPPQTSEAIIRDVWPSVAAYPAAASFSRWCNRVFPLNLVLAPIGWLALAPLYFKKLLAILPPFSGLAERYRLTNRRLAVCRGMRAAVVKDVPSNEWETKIVETIKRSKALVFFVTANSLQSEPTRSEIGLARDEDIVIIPVLLQADCDLDGDDQLCGGVGGDYLYGRLGADVLRGEDGNDRLYGSRNAEPSLSGERSEKDVLVAGFAEPQPVCVEGDGRRQQHHDEEECRDDGHAPASIHTSSLDRRITAAWTLTIT